MAHSLSSQCTPLKHSYDSCFNAWFEGYLQPIANGKSGSGGSVNAEERLAQNRRKAEDYEARCGKIWQNYRNCVQKAVEESGLTDMLREAQQEHPLKVPSSPSGSQQSTSSLSSSPPASSRAPSR